jgi:hypothetical protein
MKGRSRRGPRFEMFANTDSSEFGARLRVQGHLLLRVCLDAHCRVEGMDVWFGSGGSG